MLISNAYAQTAAPAGDPTGGMSFLVMMAVMFVALYFITIRPQMKRQKEHRAMLDAIAKGDEVVTAGGIAGKVAEVSESFIKVEVASGVEVLVQKPSIAAVLPKGTLKNA